MPFITSIFFISRKKVPVNLLDPILGGDGWAAK